jgi:SAM-dependent methyltransferase
MPVWDDLFKQGEFRWQEPDPRVVELTGLLKEKGPQRVLDLGCGSGRHLVYLAKHGLPSYGLDISEAGLELAHQRLEREGFGVGMHGRASLLVRSEMTLIPFRNGSFEGLIGIHVIQHQRLQGIRQTMREIRRVLCPGGLLFLTFPGRRDHRFGQGKELEPNTFIANAGPDSGVPHHYCNLAEIEELLGGFVISKPELPYASTRVRGPMLRASPDSKRT